MKKIHLLASIILLIFNMHAMEGPLSNNNNDKSEEPIGVYTFISSNDHKFKLDAKIVNQSPVFKTMFSSGMKEQETKVAQLPFESSTLEPLFRLMHGTEIKKMPEADTELINLLHATDQYQMPSLFKPIFCRLGT